MAESRVAAVMLMKGCRGLSKPVVVSGISRRAWRLEVRYPINIGASLGTGPRCSPPCNGRPHGP